MSFNHQKLRGKIKEIYGTQAAFAEQMRISTTSVNAKINGHTEFTQDEIFKAAELLGIDTSQIAAYFFTPKV